MALVFDKNNIELKFLTDQKKDNNGLQELIVYPIISYKIYAPVIEDLELNIFQKYILSILNKGNFTLDQIAAWLNLDILLIKTIAIELANKRLLDNNSLIITDKGKDLIEGSFSWFNNAEDLKKDIRYIFQDVFTQELFPVNLAFDNFKKIKIADKKIFIGSKGSQDEVSFKLIKPSTKNLNDVQKPESDEVLIAIQKYASKFIPNPKDDLKKIPNAIHFLGDEPDLIFCAFWISIDSKNKTEENIKITDPFNIYEEPFWLKDIILKAKIHNDDLKDVFHELIYKIGNEEKTKFDEFMISFGKELEKEISQKFDFTLNLDYKILFSALKDYYFDIKFYQNHKDVSYLRNSFRKSQIVLETLLSIIYEKHTEDCKSFLSSQTKNGKRFFAYKNEIIAKIHQINPNADIPDWKHEEFNGVYAALNNPDNASLRALFIGAVLISFYNNKNSFYNIIKNKNNLAVCIENISESRNAHGHKYKEIRDSEIEKNYEDVLIMQKDIEEIIKLFLKN
jgi:hypothetical protein